MVNVPATKDLIQEFEGNLQIPEIRVWCHPHRVGSDGDDYAECFHTFQDALMFIKNHPKLTEEMPLIAFRGYELNIFAMDEVKKK